MPIRGERTILSLAPMLRDGPVDGAVWADAHTHIGQNDPDGVKGTPAEILRGLDAAGHARALLFAMHEPDGYEAANDAVLAACSASGGRLVPLSRVDPKAPGAVEEARRCLSAGAVGIKLHPRSDAFGLPHPVVDELVALAAADRRIVLFHAGRGIPNLGAGVAHLARENPGARVVLAHAGISDLGLLRDDAAELPNLLFDTSWWQIGDMLDLLTSVPPGRVLYASDMPYGHGLQAAFLLRRAARQAGWSEEQLAVAAGAQLEAAIAGEELHDLGPALGTARVGPRSPRLERVVGHTASALQIAFRGGDAAEPLALARLGCQHQDGDEHAALLAAADRILEVAMEHRAGSPEDPRALGPAALLAHVLCGTPAAGVLPTSRL
jgi:predicted TIM-barrel fold metal-dependent hydrolase